MGGGEVQSKQALDVCGANLRGDLWHRAGIVVHEVTGDGAACPLLHQVKAADDRVIGQVGVHAAGEAVAGFRAQFLPCHGAPGVDQTPTSAFEEDVFGVGQDLGFQSAHDAGERERSGSVGDEDGVRLEPALGLIQRDQGFAGLGGAGDDGGGG
ncbi:MAG TPA: hypothetical protein PKD55_18090, partial [Bellilinea sp.]|nr:hypothetical protein [Bellilinea sp.]